MEKSRGNLPGAGKERQNRRPECEDELICEDKAYAEALCSLRQYIPQVCDPAQLRDLVLEINSLLYLIEKQTARLEGCALHFLT
jgi:hypothetical protein